MSQARPTIAQRAIRYARAYPGHSATQIAHALKANPCTVSAALYRAWRDGKVSRSEVTLTGPGTHWNPSGGGGPRGGHVYGKAAL